MTSFTKQARLALSTFIPQRRKPDPRHKISESDKALTGKTIVFTGGTDGMGRVAVEMLYNMGANIVLLGRNDDKGKKVIEEIEASGGMGNLEFQRCDVSLMQSVHECAIRILAEHNKIDILVNCAGCNAPERVMTSEGFENIWASNYLGPFLLTEFLLDKIKKSESSRIVNLSSETEALGHINFEDIPLETGWSTLNSYAQAKLAVNMYTISLAQELQGTGVTVNSLNPGFIHSNLPRDLKGAMQGFVRTNMYLFASPPEVGADRIVRLAISSEYEGVNGVYVSEDTITQPNPEALDSDLRKKLEQVSQSLVKQWLETA